MKRLKENVGIITITITSFLTHFIFFGYPRATVFDEVHFGKFVSGYFDGSYFFDIHPPLAKLLITWLGALGGYQPTINFNVIGEQFTDINFIWLRLLPTLAGTLLPIVIYYLCRSLNFSKLGAFLAGILVVLENSLLVQSRFILLDSLLLFFGFSSLLFYFQYQKQTTKRFSFYLLLGALISASFAFSVKWTGVSFFALIFFFECIRLLETKAKFKEIATKTFFFFIVPLLIYLSVFAIHFTLLYKTGPGKDFMSKGFQKTLDGNKYQNNNNIAPIGFLEKFAELNIEMYKSNERIADTHPYSSKWYMWPSMNKPIYYWDNNEILKKTTEKGGKIERDNIAKIYLLGNPLIYWLGSLLVPLFIFYIIFLAWSERKNYKKNMLIPLFLFFGFFLNLLPFIFIDRVMFLYHYFSSLIFSIIIISYLIDQIKFKKTQKITAVAIVLISTITFIYFSPLTYGLPMTRNDIEARFWFKTWK